MENAFFPTPVNNRPEAIRWFSLAETMLLNHDWLGCRKCAVQAREIDGRLGRVVDEIVVIADTLLAGERRTVTNQRDWYGILGLTPLQGRNMELVSSRYHNLVYILNPQRNRFPFAAQAFSMVRDAWHVLFNPMRKSLYDRELGFYLQPPNMVNDPRLAAQLNFRLFGQCSTQPPMHVGGGNSIGVGEHASMNVQVPWVEPVVCGLTPESQQIMSSTTQCNLSGFGSDHAESFPWSALINDPRKEGSSTSAGTVASTQNQAQQNHPNVCNESLKDVNVGKSGKDAKKGEEKRPDSAKPSKEGSTFWTVCPYCFYVYEYFDTYVNRAMVCQTCRKTFHAVEIESPPQAVEGQEAYYACWGSSLPFGVSIETWNNRNITSNMNAGGVNVTPPVAPQVGDDAVNGGVCGVGNLGSSSRVNADDQKYKVIVEIHDSSDEERDNDSRKGKKLCVGDNDKTNVENEVAQTNAVGQVADLVLSDKFMQDFGSDLDMEVFNKFEEPGAGTIQGNGEDDAMDGHALFEGLDEFLSALPAATEDGTN